MSLPDWAIGVCVSLVGSVTLNIGLNIQKKGHSESVHLKQTIFRNRLWWLGFGLFIAGNAGDFIALGYAAQSLITPLGSVSLVSNAFMAHFFLREPFTRNDLIATISIIAGAILAIVFADHSESEYTLDQLLDLYVQPGMIAYFVVIISLLATITAIIYKGNHIIQIYEHTKSDVSHESRNEEDTHIARDGQEYQEEDSAMYLLYDVDRHELWKKILAFSYTSIGALIGSQTVLTAKCSSELLQSTFDGDNQLIYPLTYLIFFFAIATAVSQVVLINLALRRFDALYVVPVFYVIWTVFSIIGGGIYFEELDDFSIGQYFAFFIGVLMTFFGVYLLSNREHGRTLPSEVRSEPVLLTKSLEDKFNSDG